MARVKDCIQPGGNSDDASNPQKTVEDVNDGGNNPGLMINFW
jgi:hypothetical protein